MYFQTGIFYTINSKSIKTGKAENTIQFTMESIRQSYFPISITSHLKFNIIMFMRNYGWEANNIVYITESSIISKPACCYRFAF